MNEDDTTVCADCGREIPTDEAHVQHNDGCTWSTAWEGNTAECTCDTVLEVCVGCCRDCQRAA